jgi:outer membrane receptor for ferrienterochelin and colicins
MKYSLKKLTLTAALLGGSLLSSTASAQSMDYGTFEDMFGEPVTKSATGTPQRVSDVPLNMEIVTQEEIRRSGSRDIPTILRRYAGLNVRQVTETQSEVGVRGFGGAYNDRILVLVNGRQVFLDYFGLVVWESIPVQLAEIQQIEVVKGPNTALFGFNAVSGVVNIITKSPLLEDVDQAEVVVGTQNYREGSLIQTLRLDEMGAVRFSASGAGMNTFDDAPAGVSPFGKPIRQNSENSKVNLTGEFQTGENTTTGFEFTRSTVERNEGIADGTSIAQVGYTTRSFKANINHDSGDYGLWEALVYRNEVEVPDINQAENQVTVAQLSNIFKLGNDHTFRVMGEYRDNRASAYAAPTNQVQFDVWSVGALHSWNINDQWSLTNGLRSDSLRLDYKGTPPTGSTLTNADHDQRTIEELSINSGLVYKMTDDDTFRLTYARGIDIPSFVELAAAIPNFVEGSPYIQSSIITNYEFGYERAIRDHDAKFKAAVFYQEIVDQQRYAGPSAPLLGGFGTYINNGDADVYGLELALDGNIGEEWNWGLNYSYTKASNSDAKIGIADQADEGYPDHMANATLGYTKDAWEVDAFATYYTSYLPAGATTSTATAGFETDSQFLLSARVGYIYNDHLTFALSGKNLNGDHDQSGGQELEPQGFLSATYKF